MRDPSRVPRSKLQPFLLGYSVCPVTHFSPRHHSHLALHPDCPHLWPNPTCSRPKLLPSCPSLAFSVSDTGTNLHSSSRTRSPVLIFPLQPWPVYISPTLEFCQFYPKYFWTPLPSVPAFASHGLNYLQRFLFSLCLLGACQ